jgi:diaminohydroxyphosphoribosylaminopyrimidine deaminase/5-amino-6-(5-phosphoribosylamino)uracil reductase
VIACGDDEVDLRAVLQQLSQQHAAMNVLVEAGPGVLGRALTADLVDECVVYVAPMLLGDAEALPAAHGRESARLTDARRFTLSRAKRCGDDIELTYRRATRM